MAVVCAFLAHEWGHFLGPRAGGSVVHPPAGAWTLFLFKFDRERNGRSQFLAMSLGGFAASALVLAVFLLMLPWNALATKLAVGFALFGVVLTLVLEVPVAWRVGRGAPLPRGAVYQSSP